MKPGANVVRFDRAMVWTPVSQLGATISALPLHVVIPG